MTDETHGRLLAPVRSAGSYSGRIYAIASHVGSILLYARRDLLEKRGIELPPSGQSWDLARFTSILEGLAVGEPGRPVLEIDLGPHRRHAAEALLPALASAGGALIDLRDRPRVLGVFDSQENISVLSRLRDWMRKGWLVVRPDDGAGRFADGGVPLSWAWSSAGDVYRRRWGDAVAVLPLPDFARGSRFLIDAWGWAVTRDSAHVQAAMSLLEFMLEDARQLTIAQTGHSLPASRRALSAWADEGRGEAALLHRAGLDAFVVVPPTPAYPLIARTLNKVVGEVLSGQDPGPRLHEEALALQHKIAGFERP